MTLEQLVLSHLFVTREQLTSAEIAKAINKTTDDVSKTLYVLKKKTRVSVHSNKKHGITDAGANYCATTYGLSDEDIKQTTNDSVIEALTMESAFMKLEKRMGGVKITNMAQKIDVITRLSVLMDESIADVLKEVVDDLNRICDC